MLRTKNRARSRADELGARTRLRTGEESIMGTVTSTESALELLRLTNELLRTAKKIDQTPRPGVFRKDDVWWKIAEEIQGDGEAKE